MHIQKFYTRKENILTSVVNSYIQRDAPLLNVSEVTVHLQGSTLFYASLGFFTHCICSGTS